MDDSAAPEKADGAGGGGGGFVSDFELMLERKKEEKRKRRRRKDIDLINDNDDAIAKMIADMRLAARSVCTENTKKRLCSHSGA